MAFPQFNNYATYIAARNTFTTSFENPGLVLGHGFYFDNRTSVIWKCGLLSRKNDALIAQRASRDLSRKWCVHARCLFMHQRSVHGIDQSHSDVPA
jgi:hypothetical protein